MELRKDPHPTRQQEQSYVAYILSTCSGYEDYWQAYAAMLDSMTDATYTALSDEAQAERVAGERQRDIERRMGQWKY